MSDSPQQTEERLTAWQHHQREKDESTSCKPRGSIYEGRKNSIASRPQYYRQVLDLTPRCTVVLLFGSEGRRLLVIHRPLLAASKAELARRDIPPSPAMNKCPGTWRKEGNLSICSSQVPPPSFPRVYFEGVCRRPLRFAVQELECHSRKFPSSPLNPYQVSRSHGVYLAWLPIIRKGLLTIMGKNSITLLSVLR